MWHVFAIVLDGVIYVSNFGSKEVNVQLVCKTLMNV